ncbi:MAG: amidase, partial [Chloroflexota bacterium]
MDSLPSQSLPALSEVLRSGRLPLMDYLTQVEERFERGEPAVLAFVPEDGRFTRLRREAAVLLEQYPEPEERPPLFGVPVGVKDIFQVKGFLTRAGSRLPPELLQGTEADSVRRLRQAGALILGKTVSTEFAYFAPGPTRNPHNPAHTPGGSSSGSAAAVGAGLCPLALGTQTIGSIVRPAAFCGVVGFKPSYERIPRSGVIPLSESLDHVGFFTADVDGAALVASLLCQEWRAGMGGWGDEVRARPVLGVPEGPYLEKASAEGLAHFRETCGRLADAGYEVKPVAAMADFQEIVARHQTIVAAEAARFHAGWFARYEELYHPKTAELIRRGQAVSEAELAGARAGRQKLRHELEAVMGRAGLGLWLSPAAPGPAPTGLDSTGDPVM